MLTKVEEVYATYIRPLSPVERLRLLELTARELIPASLEEKTSKHNIMELHGLGAEIWQGMDAQDYVHALRDEWDQP
jgi:hypothetical protein